MLKSIALIISRYAAPEIDSELFSNPGTAVRPKLSSKLAPDGSITLVVDGEIDMYSQIQACAASTDMKLILARYMNGDPTALSRRQGFYGDISEMPTSMHEALDLMLKAQSDFDTLPKEVREAFDFDCYKYISSFGTPAFNEIMSKMTNQSVDQGETPVVQDAQKGE